MEGPEIIVSKNPMGPEQDVGFSNPWTSHGFGPKQSHDRVIRLFKDIHEVISRNLSYEELNLSRNFIPEQKKDLEKTIVVGLTILLCFGFQFIDYLYKRFKKHPYLLDSFGYNNHSVQLWGITPEMLKLSGDIYNPTYRDALLKKLEESIKLLREGVLESSFSTEDQLISSVLSDGAIASFENRFTELLVAKPSAEASPLVSLIRLLEIPGKVNDIVDLLWTISVSYREGEHIHLFQGVSTLLAFISDINSSDQLGIWRDYAPSLGKKEPRPHYRQREDRQLQSEKVKQVEKYVKEHGVGELTEEQKQIRQSKKYSVYPTDDAKKPAHDQKAIPDTSVSDLLTHKQRQELNRELATIGMDEPDYDFTDEDPLPPGKWFNYEPDEEVGLAYAKKMGRIMEYPDEPKIFQTYEEAGVPMQHLDDLEDKISMKKKATPKKKATKKKAQKKKGKKGKKDKKKPKPTIQKKKKDKKKSKSAPKAKAGSKGKKKKKQKKPKQKKDRIFTLKIKYN